jgi:adenosine 3'-phospho 5'-phosphosulfate transporter B2
VAVVIGLGVALFMFSQHSGPVDLNQTTSFSGVVLMFGYLAFDSFTSQWQDVLFKEYALSSYQMMIGINAFSAVFTFVSVLQSGELGMSIDFLAQNVDCAWCVRANSRGSSRARRHVTGFSLAGAIGQTFIFFTIKEFGPLVFTIITSTRQLVAIVLSVIIYGHNIALEGVAGAAVVFAAIAYRVWRKENEDRARKEQARRAKSSEHENKGDPEDSFPLVPKEPEKPAEQR